MPWGCVVDGSPERGLTSVPLEALSRGDFNRVPVVMGYNHDEGSIFVPMLPILIPGTDFPPNDAAVDAAVKHFLGSQHNAQEVLRVYPNDAYPTRWRQLDEVVRDWIFACGTRRVLRALSAHGVATYQYFFQYKLDGLLGDVLYSLLGDYHASELPFVFNHAWPPVVSSWSHTDQEMAATFNAYWKNFAYHGDPNGPPGARSPRDGNVVPWPRYNRTTDLTMLLDVPAEVQANLLEGKCDFWDTMPL